MHYLHSIPDDVLFMIGEVFANKSQIAETFSWQTFPTTTLTLLYPLPSPLLTHVYLGVSLF